MCFDAVRVQIHDEGLVRNKPAHLAVGISCAGHKEPGRWIEQTESTKLSLTVTNDMKAGRFGCPDRRAGRSENLSGCNRGCPDDTEPEAFDLEIIIPPAACPHVHRQLVLGGAFDFVELLQSKTRRMAAGFIELLEEKYQRQCGSPNP